MKINPSIVPILGNIIPEPFAIPITLKFLFSTLNLDFAPLINVSVVHIDSATSFHEDSFFFFNLEIALIIIFSFKCSPITPVEQTYTSLALQPI